MSFDSRAVRKKTRPMRPNPLTPTRVLIRGLLVGTTDRRSRQLGPNYTAAQRTRATVTAPIQPAPAARSARAHRSEEHTSELQPQSNLVCRLLLVKKRNTC